MNATDRFNAFLERAKETDTYWTEKAIIEYTEEMVSQMAKQEVSRTELARRLGKNPAFVTKLLRGNNNFTFDTVVRIARALEMEFVPHMKPVGWQTRWLDCSPTKPVEKAEPLGIKKKAYAKEVPVPVTGEENETFALTA